ncbi:MAG: hypothetical protein J0G28_06120 [Afipia sp.]|nr:hypothetical protein [Afipia sp.]
MDDIAMNTRITKPLLCDYFLEAGVVSCGVSIDPRRR